MFRVPIKELFDTIQTNFLNKFVTKTKHIFPNFCHVAVVGWFCKAF